jgi:hypothetical protein
MAILTPQNEPVHKHAQKPSCKAPHSQQHDVHLPACPRAKQKATYIPRASESPPVSPPLALLFECSTRRTATADQRPQTGRHLISTALIRTLRGTAYPTSSVWTRARCPRITDQRDPTRIRVQLARTISRVPWSKGIRRREVDVVRVGVADARCGGRVGASGLGEVVQGGLEDVGGREDAAGEAHCEHVVWLVR